MFKLHVSFARYQAEKGEREGDMEKQRLAISDSHYYRTWYYFAPLSSSSGISESFVVKINPLLGLKNNLSCLSASLLHCKGADVETMAHFQVFQIRKIRHMFIKSVSNT